MTANKKKKREANATEEFPALREFFAGYLHQDFRDEYGSAAGAVKSFRKDASAAEMRALQREWKRWSSALKKSSPDELAKAARRLGAAWYPRDQAELDELGKSFG
jgi:hypothetical protein